MTVNECSKTTKSKKIKKLSVKDVTLDTAA